MITDRQSNLVDFCYSRLCCTSWLYCFQNPWFSSRPNEAGGAVAQLLMLQTDAVHIWFYCFTIFWTGKSNIQLLSQILDFFGTIAISQASNRPWLEKLILMYLCCALIFQTCSFRKMLRRGACLRCLQKFDFPYFENYVLHFSCPVISKTLCDMFKHHIVISQIGWNVCCQFANSTLIFENNIS